MNKLKLRDRMLALEESELEHAVGKYRLFLDYARIDGTEPIEVSEASQATAAAELAEAFDHPVNEHAQKLAVLREIDFGPKSVVELGAVVSFEGRNFVISVATGSFELDEETFMGISTQAPVFKAMEGLKAGDAFAVNNQDFVIEAIC